MPPSDLRVTTLALLSVACAGPGDPRAGAFAPDFVPPEPPVTGRLALEPLGPEHTELDHAALMGSREHLRRTLRWGDWPRDGFTALENRGDLERHRAEFDAREAYAWTVLRPDRTAVVGCVYLEPAAVHGLPEPERSAALFYWVVEDGVASDLDAHLLRTVVDWIDRDWPLDTLWLLPHREDERGQILAARARFRFTPQAKDGFLGWKRTFGKP